MDDQVKINSESFDTICRTAFEQAKKLPLPTKKVLNTVYKEYYDSIKQGKENPFILVRTETKKHHHYVILLRKNKTSDGLINYVKSNTQKSFSMFRMEPEHCFLVMLNLKNGQPL